MSLADIVRKLARRTARFFANEAHYLRYSCDMLDLRAFPDLPKSEAKALGSLNRTYGKYKIEDIWDFKEDYEKFVYKIPQWIPPWRYKDYEFNHGWNLAVLTTPPCDKVESAVFDVLKNHTTTSWYKEKDPEPRVFDVLRQLTYASKNDGVATVKDDNVDIVLLNGPCVYLRSIPEEIYDFKRLRALALRFAKGADVYDLNHLNDLEVLSIVTGKSRSENPKYPREIKGRHGTYRRVYRKYKNCRIKGLDSLAGSSKLRVLYLEGRFKDIRFLEDMTNLEQVGIFNENRIKDLNPIRNLKNLTELRISNVSAADLSPLEELASLRKLYIDGRKLQDPLSYLIQLRKRYGNLDIVRLGRSSFLIDYSRPEIQKKIKTLEDMGVKVIFPGFPLRFEKKPDYKESIAKWLERIFKLSGGELEKNLERITEKFEGLKKLEGGYSSHSVTELDGVVVKIDKPKRAAFEHRILSLDLGEYSEYAPKVLSKPETIDDLALWTMNDITQERHGSEKSGISDEIEHNMKAIGLFHYNATEAVKGSKEIVLPVGHSKIDGLSYQEGILEAYGKIDQRLNGEKRKLEELTGALKAITQYLQDPANADTVIHGDFKKENIKNGHIVDYGNVRWGSAVEDLMRYFISKGLNEREMRHYVGRYIHHRSQYDSEFKENKRKHKEMYSLIPSIKLKENLRFGCALSRRPEELIRRDMPALIENAYDALVEHRKELV
jgi:hypothetical protein